jgi:hypothetical protein
VAKMKEISEEIKTRCCELHWNQGWSYTKIGREVKLDRRTVSAIIRKREELKRRAEIGSARRDLAGEYLKGHFADLEYALRELLQLTVPPYLRGSLASLPTDLESVLMSRINERSFRERGMYIPTMGHTIEETFPESMMVVDRRIANRETEEIVTALKEHFPRTIELINRWDRAAEIYDPLLKELKGKLKTLAVTLQVGEEEIEKAIQPIIAHIHDKGSLSEDEPTVGLFQKSDKATDITRQILEDKQTVQEIKKLTPYLHDFDHVFEELEKMASPSTLRKEFLTGRCRLCPTP